MKYRYLQKQISSSGISPVINATEKVVYIISKKLSVQYSSGLYVTIGQAVIGGGHTANNDELLIISTTEDNNIIVANRAISTGDEIKSKPAYAVI